MRPRCVMRGTKYIAIVIINFIAGKQHFTARKVSRLCPLVLPVINCICKCSLYLAENTEFGHYRRKLRKLCLL